MIFAVINNCFFEDNIHVFEPPWKDSEYVQFIYFSISYYHFLIPRKTCNLLGRLKGWLWDQGWKNVKWHSVHWWAKDSSCKSKACSLLQCVVQIPVQKPRRLKSLLDAWGYVVTNVWRQWRSLQLLWLRKGKTSCFFPFLFNPGCKPIGLYHSPWSGSSLLTLCPSSQLSIHTPFARAFLLKP